MGVSTGFYYDVFTEHGYGTEETTEHVVVGPFFDSVDNPFGILPESKEKPGFPLPEPAKCHSDIAG
jgi:hypothetical protein